MEALKAKFPNHEIGKSTKKKEGEIVIYYFEFTEDGRKFEKEIEVTATPDGNTIEEDTGDEK